MSNGFLAKSSGVSLAEHTGHVLETVDSMQVVANKQVVANTHILPWWWEAVKYAALLHDLGKINPPFQEMLKKGNFQVKSITIPHGLASIFLVKPENITITSNDNDDADAVISSIAFHHWREYFPDLLLGSRSRDVNIFATSLLSNKAEWEKWLQDVAVDMDKLCLFQKYSLDKDVVGLNERLIEDLADQASNGEFNENNLGSNGFLIPPYTLSFLPGRIKQQLTSSAERLRIFITGNLMRADHFASYVEESPGVSYSDIVTHNYPSSQDIQVFFKNAFKINSMWQEDFFNQKPALRGDDLVLVAPTGAGKTEFAYIWGAGRRNIVTLPMQAAVNGIYKRIQELYKGMKVPGDQVSLLHGNAALELYRGKAEGNSPIDYSSPDMEGEIRQALEFARHFSKQFMVCTADQVAPAVLRYPGFEKVYAVLMDSCLVIDEIQAYDPRAAAIITHLIQQNHFLGGKTLLMTATLPAFIQEEVFKRTEIPGGSLVKLLDLPEFEEKACSTRHRLELRLHCHDYQPFIEEIIEKAGEGKKVLVVLNTLSAASFVYDEIVKIKNEGNYEILLLHSRFTSGDRKVKEEKVYQLMPNRQASGARENTAGEKGCIVVATQVVEASLDLDADFLFTDAAPADSLIQRMGRVFRRFSHHDGDNAPQHPNVTIMVNRPQAKKGSSGDPGFFKPLAPGIGSIKSAASKAVYDFDLTMLTLVMMAGKAAGGIGDFSKGSIVKLLEDKGYQSCFRIFQETKKKKVKDSEVDRAQNLVKIINIINNSSSVVSEGGKLQWVETCYQLYKDSYDSNGNGIPGINVILGNYINSYYETLEMLDHGYCSDKKSDAQRTFREVSDVTIIPKGKAEPFYKDIAKMVAIQRDKFSYLELAAKVLPKYTVNCSYYALNENPKELVSIEQIIKEIKLNPGYSGFNLQKTNNKLSRWLNDFCVVDIPYNSEKGLMY